MELELTVEEAEVVLKLLKESIDPLETIAPEVVSDNDIESAIGKIEGAKRAAAIWNLLLVED